MPVRIVSEPITRSVLAALAEEQFGDMVKAIVAGERSPRGVEDATVRRAVREIVTALVQERTGTP